MCDCFAEDETGNPRASRDYLSYVSHSSDLHLGRQSGERQPVDVPGEVNPGEGGEEARLHNQEISQTRSMFVRRTSRLRVTQRA